MLKRILSLFVLSIIILNANAQDFVSTAIRGENGISKQFAAIADNQSFKFNPAQINALLKLNNAANLILKRTEQDKAGFIHYRFYQTYKNIPIENSMFLIHTKNGLLKSLGGSIVTDFDATMDKRAASKISSAQSIDIAVKHVSAKVYAWQDEDMQQRIKIQTNNPKASYLPKASLVWYSPTEDVTPTELRLCYKVDVYATEPLSRAYYFVDAIKGTVIGKKDEIFYSDALGTAATAYSGSVAIHSDLNAGSYRLRDYTKGNGVITLHGEKGSRGNDYSNSTSDWTLTGLDIAALDAHYGVSQTYAFYFARYSRNSYDNAGTALVSYVNDPKYTDNAYWDGTSMNFNKRAASANQPGGVTGIDVTGHELTHGVTQETSALVYKNEPGAINESMSDIFGKSVQFWSKPTDINWQISNDMGWIIRDMSNPNLEAQPDTYKGQKWATGVLAALDNGGVHTNSGVGNFMFYLLVTGGSGTNDNGDNYSVSGIGITEADDILYRTNTVYLVPTSKYADWRTACINAATDLYGPNSNEVTQVENAWHAVGIGAAGTGGGVTYCTSAGESTAREYINLVALSSIDYVSGNNNGYGDFTAQSTSLVRGNTYTLQVQTGFIGAKRKEGWSLYIDYNGDGDFVDAGEKITFTANTTAIVNKVFTVPATAKPGTTRMRIQMHSNTVVGNPCTTFNNGEVEDYSITIADAFTADQGSGSDALISKVSVSPNPVVSSSLRLNYTLAKPGNIALKLTDANGLLQGSYRPGIQNKGANSYLINNVSSLHNGYYYLSVEQDGKIIGRITVLVAH